jgi:hypothetical protein
VKNEGKIASAFLNIKFYFYIIKRLHNEYNVKPDLNLSGLPSRKSVHNVYIKMLSMEESERLTYLANVLKKERSNDLERQIYSTYKAASYYVNMTKDKFALHCNILPK